MIQAAPNPSSPFHSSHIFKFTGLSVPLSNNPNVSFESPSSKKRKIGDHGNSPEVECATLPLASESTHTQVHEIIKKECEELIELIVRLSIFTTFITAHLESIQDQAKLWITLSLSK
jgi:hypothetical protein